MNVDKDAIKRFLDWEPPSLPGYKGMKPEHLHERIRLATGMPYEPQSFPPRPQQLEALAALFDQERFLLYYGMRTGKTKIGVDFLWHAHKAEMMDPDKKALVIAHAALGLPVWEKWFKQESRLRVATIETGPKAAEELEAAVNNPKVHVLLIAWGTLQALFTAKRTDKRKSKRALVAHREALRDLAGQLDAVIIDEVHNVQDHSSLRFIIADELTKEARYFLGLTGTPYGRNLYAAWAPVYLADRGERLGRSKPFFQIAYGKERVIRRFGRFIKVYDFDKRMRDHLLGRLASISLTCALEEVVETRVERSVVKLTMRGMQAAAYDRVLAEAEKARNSEDPDEQKNWFMKLRQISAGFDRFTDHEGKSRIVVFPNSAKLRWLRSFLADYDRSFQFLIFHEFTPTGSLICSELMRLGVPHGWLHGKTKDRDKTKMVRAFQRGSLPTLVANAATGGQAIDLPQADYLLFFESPVSVRARQQAEARPLNRGTKPLVIEDLSCSPTDEKLLSFARGGARNMKELYGKNMGEFLKAFRRKG